jgi:hypothetical protein
MGKDITHYTNHTKSLQQLKRKKACTCRIYTRAFSGFEKLKCITVLLLNSVFYRKRLLQKQLAKWVACHPSPPAGKYDVVLDMKIALIRCIISIMCNN